MNYFGAFIAVISSFVIVTAMRKIDCLVVEVFKGEIGFSFYCILFSKKRVEEEQDFFSLVIASGRYGSKVLKEKR